MNDGVCNTLCYTESVFRPFFPRSGKPWIVEKSDKRGLPIFGNADIIFEIPDRKRRLENETFALLDDIGTKYNDCPFWLCLKTEVLPQMASGFRILIGA